MSKHSKGKAVFRWWIINLSYLAFIHLCWRKLFVRFPFAIVNRNSGVEAKKFWTVRHKRKAVTSLVEEWNKLKIMIFTFFFFGTRTLLIEAEKKIFSRENFTINYASKQLCSLLAPVGVLTEIIFLAGGKCIFHVCHRELLWLGSFFLILMFPNYVGLKIDPTMHKSPE